MWISLLDRMLGHLIKTGDLHLIMPDGGRRRYGDGQPPAIVVHLKAKDAPRRIIQNPELGVGEAYINGDLEIENDDLFGFLTLGIKNFTRKGSQVWWQRPMAGMRQTLRRVQQYNPIGKAQKNVAHHYDLSGELYGLFLDADKQYSCAYFRHPDETLEQAQINKKAHIANKLLIKPGMKVLDIGCGWGGMALTLARDYGANVVGVTLSKEQHAVATQRAAEEGLADKVDFRLLDYRLVDEKFDRIVSVGMFEHVGVPHYREYFGHIHRMLNPDGIALIHTIGRAEPPSFTSPFLGKYIFPGGYVPSMSEAMSAIEKEDLFTTDIEIWRLHYAETLKHWHARFMENIDAARALYDDRFCRLWRYYLLVTQLSFRLDRQVVFQFQLAHEKDAVPLTRDYLYQAEDSDEMQHAAE